MEKTELEHIKRLTTIACNVFLESGFVVEADEVNAEPEGYEIRLELTKIGFNPPIDGLGVEIARRIGEGARVRVLEPIIGSKHLFVLVRKN